MAIYLMSSKPYEGADTLVHIRSSFCNTKRVLGDPETIPLSALVTYDATKARSSCRRKKHGHLLVLPICGHLNDSYNRGLPMKPANQQLLLPRPYRIIHEHLSRYIYKHLNREPPKHVRHRESSSAVSSAVFTGSSFPLCYSSGP